MRKREFDLCSHREPPPDPRLGMIGRRDALYRFGSGVGSLALSSLLARDGFGAEAGLGAGNAARDADPLAPKAAHHRVPKAKACIFLFMSGAPSQMDTFDPKPLLDKYHGRPITRKYGSLEKRLYVGCPFKFARHGKSGMEISEIFPHLATCADDIAVVRSLHTSSAAHTTATFFFNTGDTIPGSPSVGSWVVYGLGTENQDLPAFVVLPDTGRGIFGGPMNWSNGYLPAACQGTLFNPVGDPVVDLQPPPHVGRAQQRASLDLLGDLNAKFAAANERNRDLVGRMRNYELAFRMQMSVPEALDIESESTATKELYGLNDKASEEMGRKCLFARRLVERGVRFVEIFCQGWDSHQNIREEHRRRGHESDKPIAGLLKDLRQRGLLDDTLVVWGGEFGRTSDNSMLFFRTAPGRDHNRDAMVMWMAGGGVKGGTVVGETNELGNTAVEDVYHMHDVHATMLHLLGLDDMRLVYYHAGRFKRLTDLGGRKIEEILA